MAARPDPYACCTEGRLRPAWSGDVPILSCTACGEVVPGDPDHPDAGTGAWYRAALEMCPPFDDEYADGDRPPDDLDETPAENLARLEATLGFRPLPAGPGPEER